MPGTLSGILIFAQPGRIFISLRVLLKSLYPLIQIVQVQDVLVGMQLLSAGLQMLVLIDANLPEDEGWRIGAEIRQNYPRRHTVMLAHDSHQFDRARGAGLEAIPLEGMTAASLADAFYDFLKG